MDVTSCDFKVTDKNEYGINFKNPKSTRDGFFVLLLLSDLFCYDIPHPDLHIFPIFLLTLLNNCIYIQDHGCHEWVELIRNIGIN